MAEGGRLQPRLARPPAVSIAASCEVNLTCLGGIRLVVTVCPAVLSFPVEIIMCIPSCDGKAPRLARNKKSQSDAESGSLQYDCYGTLPYTTVHYRTLTTPRAVAHVRRVGCPHKFSRGEVEHYRSMTGSRSRRRRLGRALSAKHARPLVLYMAHGDGENPT